MNDCIFCKIIQGELPAIKIFECDDYLIIKDAFPSAKIHFLIIPKEHYESFAELTKERADVISEALIKIKEIATANGLEKGYRIVSNAGYEAGQRVMHTHVHILGGEKLSNKLIKES